MPKWRGMEVPRGMIWDEEKSTKTYGRFIAGPFEQGFGTTLGNSMRRVLLSSIPGAAVTSVRIDGVLHEFSTVPGVLEDVTDIILNLKQLAIRLPRNGSGKLHIAKQGAGEVTAADIVAEGDVKILNPHLHLATLNGTADLHMEMEIGWNRGYVPAEANKREGQPIGIIPIDSIFSPVRKVNYTVEDARVGQKTEYNRLILEVWTDGSISPQDAVVEAAEILRKHISIFTTYEEIEEELEKEVSEEEKKREEYLRMSINELELSVRSANCLRRANIHSIADIVVKKESDMLKYRNFGKKSLGEIKAILHEMGLSFGMKLD